MAQTTLKPIAEYKEWKGINNVDDPVRVPPGYLSLADNVYIDDRKMLHRRPGRSLVRAGSVFSLWSNGDVCLFAKATSLNQLNADYTERTLMSGLDLAQPIVYAEGGGYIFWGNESIIGYYKNGAASLFPDVSQAFKAKMIGGHLLEYFNSRLYAARDNVIVISDAAAPFVRTVGPGRAFLQLDDRVTLMLAVVDGLYIGTRKGVSFYAGRDPGEFQRIDVSDGEMFEGSGVKIRGEDLTDSGLGTYVMWASSNGIFYGGPGGQVKNVTFGDYIIKDTLLKEGASFAKDENNSLLYVFSYDFDGSLETDIELPQAIVKSTF